MMMKNSRPSGPSLFLWFWSEMLSSFQTAHTHTWNTFLWKHFYHHQSSQPYAIEILDFEELTTAQSSKYSTNTIGWLYDGNICDHFFHFSRFLRINLNHTIKKKYKQNPAALQKPSRTVWRNKIWVASYSGRSWSNMPSNWVPWKTINISNSMC